MKMSHAKTQRRKGDVPLPKPRPLQFAARKEVQAEAAKARRIDEREAILFHGA